MEQQVTIEAPTTRKQVSGSESEPERVTAPSSDDERIAAFGRAIDALRREVEASLGEKDAQYIKRIAALSRGLEIAGRGLLQISFEPVGFGLGTAALWAHKSLELMEIGHLALHGAFDNLPETDRFHADRFAWKAPIDEASWRREHNLLHHQFTNIEGKDPDIDFGVLRLSARTPYQLVHALQPISNVVSFFFFGSALALHASGMLDIYLRSGEPDVLPDRKPETVKKAQRAFAKKFLRHYGKEYVLFPLLAGPFFPKVLLGNILSEVGRDAFAAAIIYCGHVGARDYPRGTEPKTRAHWYAMQAEGARDVEVPKPVSILMGALDRQIEHHLFPRLPPNRLREIAPRVRAICDAHGVRYKSDSWPKTLRSVFGQLRSLASGKAKPAAA